MKVIYEANDGTQFDTEEKCRDYERRNSALYDISSFIATDKYGNHVPADGYGYSPDDFDYFCCFTEDGVKACEEFFRENGVPFSFKLEPNKVNYNDYNKNPPLAGACGSCEVGRVICNLRSDHNLDHLRLRTTWKQCLIEHPKASNSD